MNALSVMDLCNHKLQMLVLAKNGQAPTYLVHCEGDQNKFRTRQDVAHQFL